MKSVDYDLRYIEAGLESLEEYLLSNDVFWPLGVKPPDGATDYPQLTLGWLLLERARLEGREMNSAQREQVQHAIAGLDRNRSKWRVAWEKKAQHCFQTRARMWGDYLNEYRENPADNVDRYAYEVRLRAMLELLSAEYHQQQAETELLRGLDGFVKSVFQPDGFVWEPEIQAGFPQSKYWYLYGRLSADSHR